MSALLLVVVHFWTTLVTTVNLQTNSWTYPGCSSYISGPKHYQYHVIYSASALLAMLIAVIPERFCLSVHHSPVFCPGEWRYDRAVFSIR